MAGEDQLPKAIAQETTISDIEQAREDLARTIDAITDKVSPANVARRTADKLRQRVQAVDPKLAGRPVRPSWWRGSSPWWSGAAAAERRRPGGLAAPLSAAATTSGNRMGRFPRHGEPAHRRPVHPDQSLSLVSSSYSAGDSRPGGRSASPVPVASRTLNIQPAP